jgi:hypothetical protein
VTAIKMRTVAAATTMTVMTINRHDSDDRDVDADDNDGGHLICSVSLVKISRVLEGKFRISKTTLDLPYFSHCWEPEFYISNRNIQSICQGPASQISTFQMSDFLNL